MYIYIYTYVYVYCFMHRPRPTQAGAESVFLKKEKIILILSIFYMFHMSFNSSKVQTSSSQKHLKLI